MADKLPRASTSGKNRKQRSPSPYRLRADHPPEIAQFVNEFWQHTISTAEKLDDDFKHQALPLARIKKVMKSDPEVKMISSEVTILFEKACQIFIQELTARSHLVSLSNRRRTLAQPDVAQAIIKSDMFDFLIDIVPRDEGLNPGGGGGGSSGVGTNEEMKKSKAKKGKGNNGKGKEKAPPHALENSEEDDDDGRSPDQAEEDEEEEEGSGGEDVGANGEGESSTKMFKSEEDIDGHAEPELYVDHGHGRVGLTNQETQNLLMAQLQHDHHESQFGSGSHWPQNTFDFNV